MKYLLVLLFISPAFAGEIRYWCPPATGVRFPKPSDEWMKENNRTCYEVDQDEFDNHVASIVNGSVVYDEVARAANQARDEAVKAAGIVKEQKREAAIQKLMEAEEKK